jgi:hypothetical protein
MLLWSIDLGIARCIAHTVLIYEQGVQLRELCQRESCSQARSQVQCMCRESLSPIEHERIRGLWLLLVCIWYVGVLMPHLYLVPRAVTISAIQNLDPLEGCGGHPHSR